MSNLSVFAGEFEGNVIRITEDGRFSIYDVLVGFEVCKSSRNAPEVWKRICEQFPEIVGKTEKVKFPGKGQRETPVATWDFCEEILRILNAHPSQVAVTSDKFYPRTETQVVSVLVEAFADLNPIPQFYVHGYRIDLYLASANVAIEIDEYGHSSYKNDKERDMAIRSALGCSFIRFDPYAADFNLGKVILAIRGLS